MNRLDEAFFGVIGTLLSLGFLFLIGLMIVVGIKYFWTLL